MTAPEGVCSVVMVVVVDDYGPELGQGEEKNKKRRKKASWPNAETD